MREDEAAAMISSIGLLAIFADVAILLGLGAALAGPRVSQLARPLIAAFAFACAWLLTAAFDAMRAPGWTMFAGGAVIVVSVFVITVTVHLWTREADSDPSWWPEFEHQLALYVAEQEREK